MTEAVQIMRSFSFQINDDEVPDDGGNDDDDAVETKKEGSQRYVKRREEDVVDYISAGERVGREMRYVAETTEGERIGDWSPSPTGMRTTRFHKYSGKSYSFLYSFSTIAFHMFTNRWQSRDIEA